MGSPFCSRVRMRPPVRLPENFPHIFVMANSDNSAMNTALIVILILAVLIGGYIVWAQMQTGNYGGSSGSDSSSGGGMSAAASVGISY